MHSRSSSGGSRYSRRGLTAAVNVYQQPWPQPPAATTQGQVRQQILRLPLGIALGCWGMGEIRTAAAAAAAAASVPWKHQHQQEQRDEEGREKRAGVGSIGPWQTWSLTPRTPRSVVT